MRNPRACNPGGNSPHTVFNKMGLVAAEGRAMYTPDDKVVEGEIEVGKLYTETDFNKIIEIR